MIKERKWGLGEGEGGEEEAEAERTDGGSLAQFATLTSPGSHSAGGRWTV